MAQEAKHTPGPWVVKPTARGNLAIDHPTGMYADPVASVYRQGLPEGEANARLIAAAPDLLAALRRCLNYIENTEGELGISLGCGETARAALSKAGAA